MHGHIRVFTGGQVVKSGEGEAEQLVWWPNHTITCSVVKRRDHTRSEASIVGFVSREII